MPTKRSTRTPGNRMLMRLPAAEQRLIAAEAEAIEFGPGEVICDAGAALTHVYFPSRGVLSLFARLADASAVGVGMIRTDGMFGLGATVGRKTSDLLAISQGPGGGDRVRTVAFGRLLHVCPGLKGSMVAAAHAMSVQMARNVACVTFHPARQRIARWMLDMTDGIDEAGFSSTQAAIGATLGLQRPAVSRVATELQRSGSIRYLRGKVSILDRPALQAVACGCSIRISAGV